MANIPYIDGTGAPRTQHAIQIGDDDVPMQVSPADVASGITPLTASVTSQTDVGPFTPALGRLIVVTTTGAGTAQLLRSVDGGATKLAVTVGGVTLGPWTAPINEAAWVESEAGATFYLRLTPSSGTMTGRIAQ